MTDHVKGQRTAYHHGDLRHALVEEALRVLEESGAPAISLRAVAKAVGVSPNAPYRHYADKDALMADLSAEGFLRLLNAFGAIPQSENPKKDLISLGQGYVLFAQHNQALYRLMFSAYGYSLNSEYCRMAGEQAFGVLVAYVARVQNSGWNTAVDITDLVMGVWSFVHGWAGILLDHLIPAAMAYPVEDETFGSAAFERAMSAFLGA